MAAHARFVARTVMVPGAGNAGLEQALRCLNRILGQDGIIEEARRRRYYEKPCRKRIRESYENCRRIYNTEMSRKLTFLLRKNRPDPWLGS
uniref:28S ribosomal protein S21, mitochondrial-like protein n=1 Tax=Callorhinchus milii TaxID=7868 RepID=V9LA09_CALMI